ncbi:hypothetical protein BaRGS_00009434 [Batillaria attramentaria]|uniref:Uncharacterized protein n=1 Tax=Batillaria attramentaria TaxID=370345 RepID=A0ABD0LIU9_9CAEN
MDSSDDCFTQDVGIAINGRISPFDESSLAEKGPKTVANTRKRKMDEEGFVTPATPDIPKSSLKYGLPSHKLYEAAYDDPAEVGAAGDAESEDPEEGFHGDGERQDTDGNVVGSTSKVGAEDTAETGNGSSADSALKRYDNVSDLFEGA